MTAEPVTHATITWCKDPAVADDIARLFVAYAAPSYISHSELQIGRALDRTTWSPTLKDQVRRLALEALAADDQMPAATRLAVMHQAHRIVGFAFVSFQPSADVPYASVEDLLVMPDSRGAGTGSALLDWIANECRTRGIRRLFLESGVDNHRAHAFFARHSFAQTSVVMMRDL